jgi:two-component sensor histidine kinase
MLINDRLDRSLYTAGVGKFRRRRLIATFWIFSFLLPFIVGFAIYNLIRGEVTFLPLHITLFIALVIYMLFLYQGKPNVAFYFGIFPSILFSILFLSLWGWLYPDSDREFELILPLILLMVLQIPALIGGSLHQMLMTLGTSLIALIFYILQLNHQGRANFSVLSGLLPAFGLSVLLSLETFNSARTAEYESEKRDLLQKEIHHRVKNEATILTYLLDRDIRQTENSVLKEELAKVKARLLAVFVTHNQLYETNGLSETKWLSLKAYFQDVNQFYQEDLYQNSDQVDFVVQGPDLLVNHHDASYLGLIYNELLVNTFKHSQEPQKGTIRFVFSGGPSNGIVFTVSGFGIYKEASNRQPGRLWLSIHPGHHTVQQRELGNPNRVRLSS